MEASTNIRHVPLGHKLLPHVSAMFIVDCGATGFDETMLPEMGVTLFSLSGDWAWGGSPAGRQQGLGFGTLIGPVARAIRITGTPHARVAGFSLSPLGWAQLIGKPTAQMVGRSLPLDEIFDEATELVEHLGSSGTEDVLTARLERWLERRLHFSSAPDPTIARMSTALANPEVRTVEALAAATGMTLEMLERRCPSAFGLLPEPLVERQIFLHALRQLQQSALEGREQGFHGSYPDEAAFEGAFRLYMGQSVAAYLASPALILKSGLRAASAAAQARAEV